MKEIIVIGAGASGLMAAITAVSSSPEVRVTVLEGLDKAGKKILATGNGRCNLTNRDISPAHYHTSTPEVLSPMLERMPAQFALQLFEALHLPMDTEEMGRVYPHSRQASSVRESLLRAARRFGRRLQIHTQHRVTDLKRTKAGFQAVCENGSRFEGDAVILSAGGCAAPKQGSNGSGLELARRLGHRTAPAYPCLTAFRCDSPLCKGLKGVRGHGRLELQLDGRTAAVEDGEIQFTDYGISGIPAFQLSCHCTPGCGPAQLLADLLPDHTEGAVCSLLESYRLFPQEPIIDALPGVVHTKLMQAALKQAGIPMLRAAGEVSLGQCRKLAHVLKHLPFPVTGVQDWDQAQVTGGGVLLTEIDEDFASLRVPGLYLCGEVLDVVGDCGGYNLHWAWCSGSFAGAAAAQ